MGRGETDDRIITIINEPIVQVGLLEGVKECRGRFYSSFLIDGQKVGNTPFLVRSEGGGLTFTSGQTRFRHREITCRAAVPSAMFSLEQVTIGRNFHWERKETQSFCGDVTFRWDGLGGMTVINALPVERYLESVVSSEMSEDAPAELLKAHAVIARSWLGATLTHPPSGLSDEAVTKDGEIIRWYGREFHHGFDVCGDDHCQRYQGITRMKTGRGVDAVRETRGVFLTYGERICDARYHKACGGRTEPFSNVWEEREIPYLVSVPCSQEPFPLVSGEEEAQAWIRSNPPAFCGETTLSLRERILPDFDRETGAFFRWQVTYGRDALSALVREKSGIDFGSIAALIPVGRGPSGRIYRLKVVGEKASIVVGKELEIRRWFSPTHLMSSAFVVSAETDMRGHVSSFTFHGAGWGHGVGLCQIGAAVMADRGWNYERILAHYFPVTSLTRLYA